MPYHRTLTGRTEKQRRKANDLLRRNRMNLNSVKKLPVEIIEDLIPLVQYPKHMLEITVPSINSDEGSVGVIIKEEPIDIYTEKPIDTETVGAVMKDIRIKIERIDDCSINIIMDNGTV